MLYARITEGQIKYPIYPRQEYPNISFPEVIAASSLPADCVQVERVSAPVITRFQQAIEGSPALEDGVWKQTWAVRDFDEAEQAMVVENGYAELRAQRDQVLRDVVDPMGSAMRWNALTNDQRDAWGVYRQALLDLPQNTPDPFNVDWPTPPSA